MRYINKIMIKAIFFDWGNTFAKSVEVNKNEADKVLAPFGLSWKKFKPMWQQSYLLRSRGEIKDDEELENFIRKETGKKVPVKEIVRMIIKGHEIPKENIEMVIKLKKSYKVGILSNNAKEWVVEVLKRCQIEDLFDSVTISSEVCSRKPDPIIYFEALKSLAVKPDEAIFIADELSEDLVVASGLGMRTIWLKRADWKNGCDEKIMEIYKPDAIIENLPEAELAINKF